MNAADVQQTTSIVNITFTVNYYLFPGNVWTHPRWVDSRWSATRSMITLFSSCFQGDWLQGGLYPCTSAMAFQKGGECTYGRSLHKLAQCQICYLGCRGSMCIWTATRLTRSLPFRRNHRHTFAICHHQIENYTVRPAETRLKNTSHGWAAWLGDEKTWGVASYKVLTTARRERTYIFEMSEKFWLDGSWHIIRIMIVVCRTKLQLPDKISQL